MLKSLPTSNNCSVLWVSEVTAHFWGFVPHYWQKQLYIGQGAVAILDSCELQIPAPTFSTTGHVPRWLQWQDNECHHSPQKAFTQLCSWCWTPVLHQGNPSDAISCSLVDGSARREHNPKPGLSPALLLFWLALCSLKLFHSIRAPCHKPQWAQIVFGLVLCLSSTSIALAGSWCSHQEGAAPASPPRGSANTPARNTCTEWKHPHSLATGKHFSSWTWRERREARQRELRETFPRHKSHYTPQLHVTLPYTIWSNKP